VIQLERQVPPNYRMMRQFEYVDNLGRWHRVPKDVERNSTDFASIPFFLTWLVPKDGTHTPAAILHDVFIGGRVDVDYETSDGEQVTDRHADYLFREAMRNSGVAWLRRWMMWSGVALRTSTVKVVKDPASVRDRTTRRWLRIIPIAVVVALVVLLACVMALDVPDIIDSNTAFDRIFGLDWLAWFDVFGNRAWWQEILLGLATVATCSATTGLAFFAILRSVQGLVAGLVAGLTIGFLGLPMLASAIGYAGYVALEGVAAKLIGR
jgi:hypothetical protein